VDGVGGCLRRAECASGQSIAEDLRRPCAVFGDAAARAVWHDASGHGEAEHSGTVSVPRRGERRREWSVAYSVRGPGEAERSAAGA
jgi:hypothetical protein